MNAELFCNYITKFFETGFKHGFKVLAKRDSYYSYDEIVCDDMDKLNELLFHNYKIAFKCGYLPEEGLDYFSKDHIDRIFGSASLIIIPDFKKILTKKLSLLNNGFEFFNEAGSYKTLLYKLSTEWMNWVGNNYYTNNTIKYDSERIFIQQKNIDTMSWLLNSKTRNFFRIFIPKSFINLLMDVHYEIIPESVLENVLNKIDDQEMYDYLNEGAKKIVDQLIGNKTLFKKIEDYITKFENSVFGQKSDIKLSGLTKKITVTYNGGSDRRFEHWCSHTRNNRNSKYYDLISCENNFVLVEYTGNAQFSGVKKARTWANGCQFIKMNASTSKLEFLEVGSISSGYSFNGCSYSRPDFVFANKKPSYNGNYQEYTNPKYGPADCIILRIPIAWTAINASPDDVSNFLPDMGEMNINFG